MGKLIVSLSPHAHGTDTVERNMYGVIIALMPALLVSFYFFGLGSVVVTASSVVRASSPVLPTVRCSTISVRARQQSWVSSAAELPKSKKVKK